MYLRTGTKIPEQPLMINPGVSLNPTDNNNNNNNNNNKLEYTRL
jgi:hypothetical protein